MNIASFSKLGLLTIKDFLEPDLCHQLVAEVRTVRRHQGTVWDDGGQEILDKQTRKAKNVQVQSATVARITARLESLKSLVAAHYNVVVTDYQPPQFLLYEPGDFFQFHRDRNDTPDEPSFIKARQISAVIFLNSQTEQPQENTYCGGSLRFYARDFVSDPAFSERCFALNGEAGVLVTFPPTLRHQVQAVTAGERLTIVSWFQ